MSFLAWGGVGRGRGEEVEATWREMGRGEREWWREGEVWRSDG